MKGCLASLYIPALITPFWNSDELVPTSRARALYPNTLAREVWRVSDLTMRRDMMLRGIGWGTFPWHIVSQELASGELVELNLATRPPEFMRADLFVIHRADAPPGKAGTWLIEHLRGLLDQPR